MMDRQSRELQRKLLALNYRWVHAKTEAEREKIEKFQQALIAFYD